MDGYKPKTFWERPEGVTGAVFSYQKDIYMNNPEIINPDDIQAFGDISRETLDSSDSVIYSQMSKV